MIKLYYLILTFLRIIRYLLSDTKRYSDILIEVLKIKPRKIVEIGIYKGKRSKEIIQAARVFNKDIEFYGFDLFEMIKENIIKEELSKKPLSKKEVYENLSEFCKVKLFKGYTNFTLPKLKNVKADFIFIDGGHRVKTIQSDWKNCLKLIKKGTIIIFDDYYLDDKKLIKYFGCNKIVNSISDKKFEKKLFNKTDKFSHQNKGLKIKMFYLKSQKHG
tara:strand:- start:5257 stop:5907 length:651 start_codon:yes stop_codon:yes gene_type:complete